MSLKNFKHAIARINFRTLVLAVVILAVLYYFIFFSLYSIFLQQNFCSQAFDSGIDDQGIWLISRFMNPFVTVRGLNIFADSVTLYHFFVAPCFWLWDNINILYIVQTLFIVLGAIPLFLYASERLKNAFLALSVSLAYLLHPALQNMNLDQYHSEAFAVFFVIMAIYFLLKNRLAYFYIFFVLSIIGKDEIALTGIFLGFFLLFFRKQWRHALVVISLSLVWFFTCSKIIVPWVSGIDIFGPQPVVYSHWFQQLMDNLFNPAFYFQRFTSIDSLSYYFKLLGPLGFLPLLGPGILFIGFPAVAVNVLSGSPYLVSIKFHYDYVQIAVIFFALIESLCLLQKFLKKNYIRYFATFFLGAGLLVVSFISNNAYSNMPFNSHWSMFKDKFDSLSSAKVNIKKEALRLIPPEANVSASYSLVPHLSHRSKIFMFPNPFKNSYWNFWFREGRDLPPANRNIDYVIVDWKNRDDEEKLIFSYLMESGFYRKVYARDDIFVLKKQSERSCQNQGANYVLYRPVAKTSIKDDFAQTLKVKRRGVLSGIYFPFSNYNFRNLLGEELPIDQGIALEIFGYLYFPDDGNYRFNLVGSGECELRIDGEKVGANQRIKAGFHSYVMKYLSRDRGYGLKFSLQPPAARSYIPTRKNLYRYYLEDYFKEIELTRQRKRRKYLAYLYQQPNLILNGGFEEVIHGQPGHWKLETWYKQTDHASCGIELTSNRGARIAKLGNRGPGVSRWKQKIRVEPETLYRISGRIKTINVSREGAGACIVVEGESISTQKLYGTSDWQYVEAEVRIDPGKFEVEIQCRLGDYGLPNKGTAYFDNIVFKKIITYDDFISDDDKVTASFFN